MSKRSVSFISVLSLVVVASLTFAGCSDSTNEDSGGAGGEGGDHSGAEPEECGAISSVCHDEDAASQEAHECHELAHENDAAVCAANQARCVSLCTALAAGGAGGGGGEHSH